MRRDEFRAANYPQQAIKALAKIRASLIVLLVYCSDVCIFGRTVGFFLPTDWADGLRDEVIQRRQGSRYDAQYDVEYNLASTKGKCPYIIHSSINYLVKVFPLTLICYLLDAIEIYNCAKQLRIL